ncbi:MAG: hypothetical protein NTW59_02705 [Candidatus Diapherotrites archaeon]|nr:hypothetical protein [Candidatus Diapherotrites archaeon]
MEADEIRGKKEEELRNQLQERQQQAEAEMQLSSLLRSLLSDEARTRLSNIKLVNRELYLQAAQAIVYFYKAGQLKEKLSEQQLLQLLEKMGGKKEIKIRRK